VVGCSIRAVIHVFRKRTGLLLRVSDLQSAFVGPITFAVDSGECVCISGPSGSGKTVLLRAIVDLDANSGKVSWASIGRSDLSAPDWRRLVGFVPAETGWWADIVSAHFETPEPAASLLPAVGLPSAAFQWHVTRLSTGERHRLGLVRAIAQQPRVLLLDEPTASLDSAATEKVERLLKNQLLAGVAVVLVTHDPDQIQRLASRTLTIANGKLCDPELVNQ
ncbi:MAG: ABC transporter ATP-binding protein, partial [Hyphomicrobiaceae bacterium]